LPFTETDTTFPVVLVYTDVINKRGGGIVVSPFSFFGGYTLK